jgi:hypothetical protein
MLLAACLLAATLAVAAETGNLFGTPGGELDVVPHRFIRFDVADVGMVAFRGPYYGSGQGGVFLKATCQWNRFRFGAAGAEFWGDIADGPAGPVPISMVLPVYVGYDLWYIPRRTGDFYGAVPDVYVEAGVNLVPPIIVKAALSCDVDYYGVGLRAEAGGYVNPSYENTLYVALELRLLTFGIGF